MFFHFLCYSEDIRNPNKIFAWNCEKQNKFIEKGRGNVLGTHAFTCPKMPHTDVVSGPLHGIKVGLFNK